MSTRAGWKRWRWIVAGLVAALLFIAVSLTRKSVLAEFVTPDGVYRVQILQVGGANLSYQPDSRLYELLYKSVRPWLPASARRWMTAPRNVTSKADPTKTLAQPLQVLTRVTPVDPSRVVQMSPGQQMDFGELARVEFMSRDGHRFEDSTLGWRNHGNGRTTVSIGNFPRRDPMLTLLVMDRSGTSEWARVELPNPIPATDAPQWAPGPIPAVVSTPDFDCRLIGINPPTGRRGYEPQVVVIPKSSAWDSNFTTTRWEDATGNYGQNLSPFESAWKIRVDVCRTAGAEFGPAETWDLPAVPLPAPKTVTTLGSEGRVGETLIKATCLKGAGLGGADLSGSHWTFYERPRGGVQVPGEPGVTYGTIHTVSEEPFLQLDLENFGLDARLYAILVDQDGMVVGRLRDIENTMGRYARTYYRATVPINPLPTTREISGQIVVTRPRTVEFFVEPRPRRKTRDEAGAASK